MSATFPGRFGKATLAARRGVPRFLPAGGAVVLGLVPGKAPAPAAAAAAAGGGCATGKTSGEF